MAKVPGGVTEGLYAAAGWSDLLSVWETLKCRSSSKSSQRLRAKNSPAQGLVLGHSGATVMVKALEAAGKDLNPASFQKSHGKPGL